MLILGIFCKIIKSLFRKYTISLHPLYHPFSCYIKEISHLRKMADVVSSETQFGNGHHVAACQYQRRHNHQNTEQKCYFSHCFFLPILLVSLNGWTIHIVPTEILLIQQLSCLRIKTYPCKFRSFSQTRIRNINTSVFLPIILNLLKFFQLFLC